MEPNHIFYRMPPELIVKIYKRMNDVGDVKATLSTCRRAKAIFDEHAGAIAKSHLLRTIHPINVKLMVMAVASRDVDPRDQESVEQFFRRYIWRAEPWPASYITMDMVAALPFFYGCMNLLFERIWIGLWREFSGIPPTDTELARVLRTFLMIETATNLFYRAPGKNGEALRRAPHVEWVDRYWEVFSHAEIEVVLKTKPHYSGRFEYAKENIFKNHRPVPQLGKRSAYLIGLEKLYTWNQSPLLRPAPDLIEEFNSIFRNGSWLNTEWQEIETPYDDAVRCLGNKVQLQPRFQLDPDAIDEEFWQRMKREGLGKYLTSKEINSCYFDWLCCWDRDIFERLRHWRWT